MTSAAGVRWAELRSVAGLATQQILGTSGRVCAAASPVAGWRSGPSACAGALSLPLPGRRDAGPAGLQRPVALLRGQLPAGSGTGEQLPATVPARPRARPFLRAP